MMSKDRLVPVLKTNNRRLNLEFYVEKIGFTVLLEDAGLASLGDAQKRVCLEMEELPSNRALQPRGKKKLDLLVFRVQDAKAVEAGLARGLKFDELYQGSKGWAYLATSPEGDRILVHAEASLADLKVVEQSDYPESFQGGPIKLDHVELEELRLNVLNKEKSEVFYQRLSWPTTLVFTEAESDYLTAAAGQTWDLYQFRLSQADWNLDALKQIFSDQEFFVPKRENFFLTQDPANQIELWMESHG
ncbi:CppA N-terminal domain-containing protein [Streptococcus sp. NLN76]|uniref:CppA N-terminal domain-containing protein n=1 Tax=Streptococcus sp. NLN76 TaxID=2822800 RepID=UPI0018ABBB38|nr:CppA N-terminal domain-containing protein [Streptococcus sp. NLN76]MBF8970667.1 proteinase [Streptococcus sp. NLN76]